MVAAAIAWRVGPGGGGPAGSGPGGGGGGSGGGGGGGGGGATGDGAGLVHVLVGGSRVHRVGGSRSAPCDRERVAARGCDARLLQIPQLYAAEYRRPRDRPDDPCGGLSS